MQNQESIGSEQTEVAETERWEIIKCQAEKCQYARTNITTTTTFKSCKTRKSSEDDIVNMNFFYDIVHVLHNT